MRLSDWRAAAPNRESLGPRVVPVLEPVLAALGAESNPHLWISWGEDPRFRYTIFALTPGGVGICVIRPGQGGEGPRITAKLVRWGRVQLGELDVETQQAHRLLTVQLEGHVLKGVDSEADRVARFVHAVMAGIDGRQMPSLEEPARRRRSTPTAAAPKKPVAPPRKSRTQPRPT
jgi:hypothetical protein